jgi:hypothetical protein
MWEGELSACAFEFQAIAGAIHEALKPYRDGLPGLVVYLRR